MESFVTIQSVPGNAIISLTDRPEQGNVSCIACTINGGETLGFSTISINAHIRHHIKSGGEHATFMINANFTPKES